MNRWNLGQIYEKTIRDILSDRGLLPDHLCGNDAGFKHNGNVFYPSSFILHPLRAQPDQFCGGISEGDTPVPIPHTAVKPLCADDT